MGRAVRPLPALAAAGVLALVVARVPEALAGVDAFRVKEIRLEGHRFLTHEEAVRALSVSSGTSLWDDLEPLEERLRGHPLVRDARIRRRLPSTLILEVEERAPVALVPTPDLVPVDASGGTLPLDPAVHRLDLPLVHPFRERGRPDSRLAPDELRSLARELGRLATDEPGLTARISEVRWLGGALEARLSEPPVDFLFPVPLTPRRLRQGLAALADAERRWPDRAIRTVDLRYSEQVVVGHRSGRP